ncbi:hypothetical protein [Patiriisocius hiemis]|uniref:Uncharacterized protein n=1 Tax=Patiriisocius hiemis TaxID=3075604 RepID=A0ABU2YD47_9FLAO|nr:hypothetical protein [Constantimarinum sp. W242]MDT0556086.1 hypothetical protein [Constantimarinum sp. W242]
MKPTKILLIICILMSYSLTAQNKTYSKEKVKITLEKDATMDKEVKKHLLTMTSIVESKNWREDKKKVAYFKTSMNKFEKAVNEKKGGLVFENVTIKYAHKKHPGKDTESFINRYNFYIKQMERVHEDE